MIATLPLGAIQRAHLPGRAILDSPVARCELDGQPLRTHPRCRRCGILIGPGHVETTAANGCCSRCARPR